MSNRFSQTRKAVDSAISCSKTLQEFQNALAEMGYRSNLSERRSYWTVIPSGYYQPIRMANLGDDYTNDRILERINSNTKKEVRQVQNSVGSNLKPSKSVAGVTRMGGDTDWSIDESVDITERFLKYVSFPTMSDKYSVTCPSTEKQKVLGRYLADELRTIGLADVLMDENGYVSATLPASAGCEGAPIIGLVAHMDTSDEAPDSPIRPRTVEYRGGDIVLNSERGIVMREADYPSLGGYVGKHLIVTDGTTLPAAEDPAHTEGYEGFYHLDVIKGDVENARVEYIIRDHDAAKFEERKRVFKAAAEFIDRKYGEGSAVCTVKDSYRNMREIIEQHMYTVDRAVAAMRAEGVEPVITPIRGGTDGARLSYMGLPCPNLCTGGENFHSRFEYLPVESLCKVADILVRLITDAAGYTR